MHAVRSTPANPDNVQEGVPVGGRFASGVVPRAVVRADALRLHFLDPKSTDPAECELLALAYDCWSGVWQETFHELEQTTTLPSDNFSRQHEIAAFFQDGECVGLAGHRTIDLAETMARDDSYFSAWPDAALDAACKHGTRTFIGNNLTVAPAWRNTAGVSLKELIVAMSVKRFFQSTADVCVGTGRNNKSVNTVGYRCGFEPLVTDATLHGVKVDLMVLYRKTGQRLVITPEIEDLLAALLPEPSPIPRTSSVVSTSPSIPHGVRAGHHLERKAS